MNKLKLKGLSLTDNDYLSKVIALSEEDFINTDLPDLLKMVGFLYGVKISSTQSIVDPIMIDSKIKLMLEATKLKADAEFGLDLSIFNTSNLHLTFTVRNKFTIAPTTNIQTMVQRFPSLWDYLKLELPNTLPTDLNALVTDGYVVVDSKVVSKIKETSINLEHFEEVK
jgi:hypothetical protein